MAIEYSLELASSLSRAQVAQMLAEKLPGELIDEMSVCRADIVITIINPSGLGKDVIREAFHFVPDLVIRFRQNHGVSSKDFDRMMLRATMLLLEHGRDAVLLLRDPRMRAAQVADFACAPVRW